MSDPYQPPISPVTPVTNQGQGKATTSLVLGLLAILGWIIPLVGIPLTITGLVLGIKGLGPGRRGRAIAGIVLSTFFLMVSVVNMGIGAYLGATGQHRLFQPQIQSQVETKASP